MNEKPKLLYDQECAFCCRWVRHWAALTGDRVHYQPFQDVLDQYPSITSDQFKKAIVYLDETGSVSTGAEGVFRALAHSPSNRYLLAFYRHVPGFKWASNTFYGFVAAHRVLFSKVTRFLWGREAIHSTYSRTASFFLRALGAVYLAAFGSIAIQSKALFASGGILPIGDFLTRMAQYYGSAKFFAMPTLFWMSSSDAMLWAVLAAGCLFSVLLMLGITPILSCVVLWAAYLSILQVGQIFMSFQWDILLVEVGFLAMFLAPFSVRLTKKIDFQPSGLILFLLKWLVFRIHFSSGMRKILSGDFTWASKTALEYHYETQPLPTMIGWAAHQLPAWFQSLSVSGMFFIQLAVPFMIFFPRRIRHLGAYLLLFLQILIFLTGNYCFFNLLTMLLCLLLFDDASRPFRKLKTQPPSSGQARIWPKPVLLLIFAVIGLTSAVQFSATVRPDIGWPRWARGVYDTVKPFRLVNGYGLFASMTTRRLEIELEGSHDGRIWKPYEFKYKPGDVNRMPSFVAPHQPRLDWQMWFASLGSVRSNPWFVQMAQELLKGNQAVLKLLRKNPFADKPPRYLRAVAYDYHMTDWNELRETGAWWKRERKGLYMATVSLVIPGAN